MMPYRDSIIVVGAKACILPKSLYFLFYVYPDTPKGFIFLGWGTPILPLICQTFIKIYLFLFTKFDFIHETIIVKNYTLQILIFQYMKIYQKLYVNFLKMYLSITFWKFLILHNIFITFNIHENNNTMKLNFFKRRAQDSFH